MDFVSNCQRKQRRVKEIVNWLTPKYPLSFEIGHSTIHSKDVDIWVKDRATGEMIVVIEATNYSKTTRMSHKDAERHIKKLVKHRCHRVIVVSFAKNIKHCYIQFVKNEIGIKVMNNQT